MDSAAVAQGERSSNRPSTVDERSWRLALLRGGSLRSLRSGRQRACDPWQGGERRQPVGGRAKLWRRQPAHPQAPLEPEGGLPPLRGRRAERGRHISFAPQVTWGPILDPRGQCEGSIAVQRGTDSVRAGYRLGRVRAGSIAVKPRLQIETRRYPGRALAAINIPFGRTLHIWRRGASPWRFRGPRWCAPCRAALSRPSGTSSRNTPLVHQLERAVRAQYSVVCVDQHEEG